ncbi:elongation of very long chain fatty acids protein 7-like [Oppia nitens]|uniref:elongation of very long chain fatty acids protein 7-like n=1 Tax=Oppia nitens TaxID=1686743 RepID=UPI0023D9C9C0|nr:elongation of very long chain fatty acids protein 7-like [Oppia nitens]
MSLRSKILLGYDNMLHNIYYYSYDYWSDIQDPRTKHLPFINCGPLVPIIFLALYYYVIRIYLPRHMANREPYNLKKLILTYDLLMSLFNLCAFVEVFNHIDYGRVFLKFDYPMDKTSNIEIKEKIVIGHLYLLSKFMDWFDSLFFALRKKFSHLSLLHVYHHMSVPFFGWLLIKMCPFMPGIYLFILMNTFIHFLMYGYYFLSAFGPKVQKYLWWKRYITQLQLAQFLILGAYVFMLAFFQRGYPYLWIVDPRTKHLPLVNYGPLVPIIFLSLYYYVIRIYLPRHMANREPYNLKKSILTYDLLMSLFNLCAFVEVFNHIDYGRVFLKLDYPMDKTSNIETKEKIVIGYLYLFSKLMDWFDSVFFALGKKFSHLSLLHVYHHMSVPFFGWLIIKMCPFMPGIYLFILMNTLIHFLMYGYYFLSAFGPKVQKYLWWKRYITQLQLAQFLILGAYALMLAFFQKVI